MNPIIKKNGINFGLILAFLLALPTLVGYAFANSIFVSYWTLGYVFLVVIVLGLFVIGSTKKDLGGFINFKNAFTAYFLMLLIGIVISTLISIVVFNFVDPGFKEVIKEKTIEKVESQRDWVMTKMANASQEQVDEANDKFDEAIEKIKSQDQYGFGNQVKNLFFSLAFFAVFGLLEALILKKKDPEFN